MKELGLPVEKIYRVQGEKSRSGLYVAFTAVGILGGLFAREVIDGPGNLDPSSGASAIVREFDPPTPGPIYEATTAAEIYNMLHPTPTETPTPKPTATETPDPMQGLNFCATDTPDGEMCKVPYPPPPTTTPYPDCPDVIATPTNAGEWCLFQAASPVAGGTP